MRAANYVHSCSRLYCGERAQGDEQSNEVGIIVRPNTRIQPRAVVVERFDALVAPSNSGKMTGLRYFGRIVVRID